MVNFYLFYSVFLPLFISILRWGAVIIPRKGVIKAFAVGEAHFLTDHAYGKIGIFQQVEGVSQPLLRNVFHE